MLALLYSYIITRNTMDRAVRLVVVVLCTVGVTSSASALTDGCDCDGFKKVLEVQQEEINSLQTHLETQKNRTQSQQQQIQEQHEQFQQQLREQRQQIQEQRKQFQKQIQRQQYALHFLIPALLNGQEPDPNTSDDLDLLLSQLRTSGSPGPVGSPGAKGSVGQTGRQGTPGNTELKETGGAVYTRWGRTSCGQNSALLYKGFTGGSSYKDSGGGANYQCMPLDPEYNKQGSGSDWVSYISGTEYQSSNHGIFPSSAHDQNVPCARCYTGNRTAVMMIPAKRTCSSGWTKEYEGYLMTEAFDYHRTTFECVDTHPEYIQGMHTNTNGALFYFVKTDCSGDGTTGRCPPYSANSLLTCVVCTK